ncbi:MAG: gp436 family protein [Candidatus Gastranaerophilaceae bacterium]
MAYSSLENLTNIIPMKELINLTNDTAPATEINIGKINQAIEYAEELTNTYLRNKYVLPLKFVPVIIQQVATDIAAYRLYSRRPGKIPEHIKDGYEEAKKILSNLQKEQMLLDLPAEHPNEEITRSAKMITTNKTSSSRVFNDDMWSQFR